MIQDKYSRKFETLRLSVTSECNFFCTYCRPKDQYKRSNLKVNFQPPEFYFAKVQALTEHVQIKKIHLTGGEPALYPYLPELVGLLKELSIPEIAVTSNGSLTEKQLMQLKKNQITGINYSLDSLDNSILREMGCTVSVQKILHSIHTAQEMDILVKLNSTILKGLNHTEVLPLLEYSRNRKIAVRYLELMKMGPYYNGHKDYFYSEEQILDQIQSRYSIQKWNREKSATATYWTTNEGHRFGIIANHSKPFCNDCDRLRMDNFGNIYGCLSHPFGISFPQDKEQLKKALQKAIDLKKTEFEGSPLTMHGLGG